LIASLPTAGSAIAGLSVYCQQQATGNELSTTRKPTYLAIKLSYASVC